MRRWVVICCLVLGLAACTEPWDIDLNAGSRRLVISGAVGTIPDTYAVCVTHTQDFLSDAPYQGVEGARVTINGVLLQPDTAMSGRYLTAPGFAAEPGTTYLLEVWLDDDGDGVEECYSASAVAPPVVPLGSLALMPLTTSTAFKALPASTLIAFPDPVGPNFYGAHLYVTTAQDSSGVYRTLRYSDIPDKYITNMFSSTVEDGSMIYYPAFMLGRHLTLASGDSITLFPFDTLTVELNNHTEAYFTYISQLQTASSGSNPMFMSPSGEFTGNISGGALGAFGVYGASRASVPVAYTPDTWEDEEMRQRFGSGWKSKFSPAP
ncbi:MAG: DUF4249 family protein [Paludibacteraceae bacterium]|nr:DUF4249 family protein [Paludibacteraceae bacterium]